MSNGSKVKTAAALLERIHTAFNRGELVNHSAQDFELEVSTALRQARASLEDAGVVLSEDGTEWRKAIEAIDRVGGGREMNSALKRLRTSLVIGYNEAVDSYNRAKKEGRWDATNPDDTDDHGRQCGFIDGLGEAITLLEREMDKVEKGGPRDP